METKNKIITFELNKPGIKELVVPLVENGERVEVWGLVEASEPGDYRVKVLVDHKAINTFGRVSENVLEVFTEIHAGCGIVLIYISLGNQSECIIVSG